MVTVEQTLAEQRDCAIQLLVVQLKVNEHLPVLSLHVSQTNHLNSSNLDGGMCLYEAEMF
jgi:hypothetical protein